MVVTSLNQLWMIHCTDDVTRRKPLQMVSMTTLAGCVGALPLSHLSMMLVLGEGLGLYSGLTKVQQYIYAHFW